jgi:hypothetical protein
MIAMGATHGLKINKILGFLAVNLSSRKNVFPKTGNLATQFFFSKQRTQRKKRFAIRFCFGLLKRAPTWWHY